LDRDHEVEYITSTPESVKSWIDNADVEVTKIQSCKDAEELRDYIDSESIDAVFLDYFGADLEYQKILSRTDATIAVRHNYRNDKLYCDLVFYGDLHATEIDYSWEGKKPEFFLGGEYVLLREDFQEVARREKVWKEEPERALIIMGGSDVKNTTPRVMEVLEDFEGVVDTIIGPGFSNKEEIEKKSAELNAEYNLLENPSNMAEAMFKSDFAVTSAGGTVYELIAAQSPCVVVPQVDNQLQRAKFLDKQDLALVGSSDTLEEKINSIRSKSARKKIFDNIKALIDGKGAERTYKKISSY
jgi:UDP-2,4-diacetamido-2,4,6-trideoxy-beta-L-altropyranose hydrolase